MQSFHISGIQWTWSNEILDVNSTPLFQIFFSKFIDLLHDSKPHFGFCSLHCDADKLLYSYIHLGIHFASIYWLFSALSSVPRNGDLKMHKMSAHSQGTHVLIGKITHKQFTIIKYDIYKFHVAFYTFLNGLRQPRKQFLVSFYKFIAR